MMMMMLHTKALLPPNVFGWQGGDYTGSVTMRT